MLIYQPQWKARTVAGGEEKIAAAWLLRIRDVYLCRQSDAWPPLECNRLLLMILALCQARTALTRHVPVPRSCLFSHRRTRLYLPPSRFSFLSAPSTPIS